jgi:formate dehydrogenase beta subunit
LKKQEETLSNIVFSSWGRQIVDNRHGGLGTTEVHGHKLPVTFDGEREISAFMGWDGIILKQPNIDVVAMAAEYAKRIQEDYCCGKCAPGRNGTKVMQDALARIVEGRGSERDLTTIETLGELLQNCKCTLCQTSVIPIVDSVRYFREDYLAYLNGHPPATSEIEYKSKVTAPCQDKCPAHIDIPAYIEAIRNRHFDQSLSIIRESMPLPAVCGRVCPHPCETACRRAIVDAPVNIMVLKRTASDYEWQHQQQPKLQPMPPRNKSVAIIGAGPAGLTAAYFLAMDGYECTIYETLPENFGGGMIAVGIPAYRMPRNLLQREIDIIQSLGVEIIYDTKVGIDISLSEIKEKHDAVLIAPGAHKSKSMGVKGEDQNYKGSLRGGIDFLRDVYMGKPSGMGKKVCVIGGGNTAIDCLRVALREGAETSTLLYRRTREEMPAEPWEVDGAEEEGATFEFLVSPQKILADDNNQVIGIECQRMELGEADASGRRRPQPVAGSEFVIECDTIIPAIGQESDLSFITNDSGIELSKHNTVVTKAVPMSTSEGSVLRDSKGNLLSRTMMTNIEGVFACGEAEIGPYTVVACVGNAHRAAQVVSRWLEEGKAYLTDDDLHEDILNYLEVYDKDETVDWLDAVGRFNQYEIHGRERADKGNYEEVELGLKDSEAVREAERCLRCYRVSMIAI